MHDDNKGTAQCLFSQLFFDKASMPFWKKYLWLKQLLDCSICQTINQKTSVFLNYDGPNVQQG